MADRSFERMIAELRAQHASFERALRSELNRPAPDSMQVARLKRGKLTLKDRMEAMSRLAARG